MLIAWTNRRAVGRLPCASLLIAVIAVLIPFSPTVVSWLEYDRAAIATGQVWCALTCHVTHWSCDHLFWDVAVLLVLGLLCETEGRLKFVVCVAAAAAIIPAAIWWLMPEVALYRGLSGIDSALFALLAGRVLRASLAAARYGRVAVLAVVMCAFLAKIGFEYATSQTLFVDNQSAAMVPIPLAHVVGWLVGAAIAMWPLNGEALRPCRPHVTDFEDAAGPAKENVEDLEEVELSQ